MPYLLVSGISKELQDEVTYAAAKAGMTKPEWVIQVLANALKFSGKKSAAKTKG